MCTDVEINYEEVHYNILTKMIKEVLQPTEFQVNNYNVRNFNVKIPKFNGRRKILNLLNCI